MSLERTIRAIVDNFHADLPADAQRALYDLIRTRCISDDAGNPEIAVALEHYLDVMGAPNLKKEQARTYAENSLSMHSQIANQVFFKRGRKDLSAKDYSDLRRCVIDRFACETWPLLPPAPLKTEQFPTTHSKKQFTEADFAAVMAPYFNRDQTYRIERDTLIKLLERASAALEAAMGKSELDAVERGRFREMLDARYGDTIRDYIASIDEGCANEGLVHFFG